MHTAVWLELALQGDIGAQILMDDVRVQTKGLKSFDAFRSDGDLNSLAGILNTKRNEGDVGESFLDAGIVELIVDTERLIAVVGDLGSSERKGKAQCRGKKSHFACDWSELGCRTVSERSQSMVEWW